MERIEHGVNNGRSLKAVKRKRGIGINQMYAIRNKEGNVTKNMDKIVKVAKGFYRDLYCSQDNQDANGRGSSPEELDISSVTTAEVKKALETMKRGKAAGVDLVTAGLLKDGGQIVVEKLANLYTQCLMT